MNKQVVCAQVFIEVAFVVGGIAGSVADSVADVRVSEPW